MRVHVPNKETPLSFKRRRFLKSSKMPIEPKAERNAESEEGDDGEVSDLIAAVDEQDSGRVKVAPTVRIAATGQSTSSETVPASAFMRRSFLQAAWTLTFRTLMGTARFLLSRRPFQPASVALRQRHCNAPCRSERMHGYRQAVDIARRRRQQAERKGVGLPFLPPPRPLSENDPENATTLCAWKRCPAYLGSRSRTRSIRSARTFRTFFAPILSHCSGLHQRWQAHAVALRRVLRPSGDRRAPLRSRRRGRHQE